MTLLYCIMLGIPIFKLSFVIVELNPPSIFHPPHNVDDVLFVDAHSCNCINWKKYVMLFIQNFSHMIDWIPYQNKQPCQTDSKKEDVFDFLITERVFSRFRSSRWLCSKLGWSLLKRSGQLLDSAQILPGPFRSRHVWLWLHQLLHQRSRGSSEAGRTVNLNIRIWIIRISILSHFMK